MHPHSIIAIDGPAASGKSTTSRAVAHALGFLFVSSGSYYRALAWSALQHSVDISKDPAVISWLASLHLKSNISNGEIRPILNGIDSTEHHSDPAVAALVSPLAALPAIRFFLLTALRGLAKHHDLVMEGRDIGSVVFPNASFKFYLDASPEERARRRRQEGVLDSIAERDKRDATRTIAPLLVAEGAIVIDTTYLNVEETTQKVLDQIRKSIATFD